MDPGSVAVLLAETGVRWPEVVVTFVMSVVVGGSVATVVSCDADPHSKAWNLAFGEIVHGSGAVSPAWLLALRAIMAGYAVGVLTASIISAPAPLEFIFFTRWNYMLLVAFLLLALWIGLWGLMKERFAYMPLVGNAWGRGDSFGRPPVRSVRAAISVLDTSPRFVDGLPADWDAVVAAARRNPEEDPLGAAGYIYRVLYQVVPVSCVIVSAVFWAVNYPEDVARGAHVAQDLDWLSINMHGVAVLLCAVELVCVDVAFCFHHVCYLLLWACSYAAFQLLFYALGGWWVYDFLDATKPEGLLWYLGLLLFHVAAFTTAYAINTFFRPSDGSAELSSDPAVSVAVSGPAAPRRRGDSRNADARYVIGAV